MVHSPAVAKLTLLVDPSSLDTLADSMSEFMHAVKTVGAEDDLIRLRLTQDLWWVSRQDLQEAGYPSWTAFRTEHSPWGRTRTRDYLRMVGSRLDVIKEAVSNRDLTFATATRSTRSLGAAASVEAQVEWLRECKLGVPPTRHGAFLAVFSDGEMRRILRARSGANIVIGGQPPIPIVDRFLLDCHARRLTRDEVFDDAKKTPPIPDRLGQVMPTWKGDPAASLLGPYVTPASVEEAVARIRHGVALFQHRRVLLGIAYAIVRDHALWKRVPGCRSLAELCRVHLGLDQRTFQRCADEGLQHIQYPELRQEIEQGLMTLDRASFAVRHATPEHPLQIWLQLVRRLGRTELQHAEERGADFLEEYTPALELAREVEAALEGDDTRPIGPVADRIAEHLRRVGASGPVQIAVRDDRHRPSRAKEPAYILAPPELLAAADYFLAEMVFPPLLGVRRVIGHDRYTCQNPRCRNRTLRVHPHHMHQRQHGGSDEPANIVSSCPACHLRSIHTGRLSVVRIGGWLVWTWRTGGIVLMSSPVADLVIDHRTRTSPTRSMAVPESPGQPSDLL